MAGGGSTAAEWRRRGEVRHGGRCATARVTHRLGPCLWPSAGSTVWHCAHFVLKIFAPCTAMAAAVGRAVGARRGEKTRASVARAEDGASDGCKRATACIRSRMHSNSHDRRPAYLSHVPHLAARHSSVSSCARIAFRGGPSADFFFFCVLLRTVRTPNFGVLPGAMQPRASEHCTPGSSAGAATWRA